MCAVKYSLKISIGYLTEGAHFYDTLEWLETASTNAPRALFRQEGSCDVQEQPSAASSCTCYCRPGNPQALRRAPACDVQEQHASGVQPELAEHELTCFQVTATVGQGISVKTGILCGARQYMPRPRKGQREWIGKGAYPGSGLPTNGKRW